MPGHGRSTAHPEPFSHRRTATDVFALMDSLGIDRFRALGISSGGMTLLHMATQQPARVDAMVLVGATTHFGPEARAIFASEHPDSLDAAEWEGWGECSARGDEQTRRLVSDFHGYLHDYADMNFTEPYLSTIRARTLIVHGDRDEFFPVDIAVRMYTSIPGSALWILPRGGHIPIYGDAAEQFVRETLAFLAEGTAAGR